jgi:hypothetical protein
MVDCLNDVSPPQAQVQAIEEYIPYLLSIRNSIKTDKIKLKDDIVYSWTSSLSSGTKVYTYPQINFEAIMVFMV